MTPSDSEIIFNTLKGATPMAVFATATIVVKLTMLLTLGVGAVVIIAAIMRVASGGRHSGFLGAMGLLGLIFGVLGAAYGSLNSYIGYKALHPEHLYVFLPSLIVVLYALGLGVLVWLIATLGNSGAKRG